MRKGYWLILWVVIAILLALVFACGNGADPVGTVDGPCKTVNSIKADQTGKWECENRGTGENDWVKVG